MDPTKTLLFNIALAITNPGRYTPERVKMESHDEWSARAVATMLVQGFAENAPLLHTQDNRITAEPMFCVQEKERRYGIDPEWSDNVVWVDTDDGVYEVAAPPNGCEPMPGVVKTGYVDLWKTVMVAFTETGAKEYLHLNGHNHRGETRIYVESFRRCPEMIQIRALLMKLAEISNPQPA